MVGLAGAGLNAAGAASLTTPGSPGKGAPRERRGPKDDRERAEFDHVTSETLDGCADAAKLRRMEWYFRTEGFPTTAAAVGARLQQLGEATWAELDLQEQRRAEEQLQRMRGGLSSWQQDLDLLKKSYGASPRPEAPAPGSRAPVRGQPAPDAGAGAPAAGDKLQQWQERQRRQGRAQAAEIGQLSEAERRWQADREKERGNDCFRSGEVAEAAAHYTRALDLHPTAAAYANRAAAHLKLKKWDAVDADCGAALALDPAYAKALTRRCAARIELKRYEEALGDAEAALELAPDSPELIKMREKVLKLLPQKVARVTIEEDSSSDEEDSSEGEEEVVINKRTESRTVETTELGNGFSIEEIEEVEVEVKQREPAKRKKARAPPPAAAPAPAEPEPAPAPEPSPSAEELSVELKDQGNAKYQGGDLAGALDLYTRSIAQDARNTVVYVNRAQVKLKLKDFAGAEADCTVALGQDAANVKAQYRRGMARRELGKLEESLADYRVAAASLAGNPQVQKELEEVQRLLKEREQEKAAAPKVRIVEIEEESDSDEEEVEVPVRHVPRAESPAAPAAPAAPQAFSKVIPIEEDSESDEEDAVAAAEPAAPAVKSIPIEEVSDDSDSESESEEEEIEIPVRRVGAEEASERKPRGSVASSTSDWEVVSTPSQDGDGSHPASPTGGDAAAPAGDTVLGFGPPRTSVDLERALKALAGQQDALERYVALIPAETYAPLLKESLTPDVIFGMVRGLLCFGEEPEKLYAALKLLSEVKRFDINSMLIPSRKKAVLAETFDRLKGAVGPGDLAKLRKKYSVPG